MTVTCPRCSWPDPAPISAHGPVRYWRCPCGQWLVTEAGALAAAPGPGGFAAAPDFPENGDSPEVCCYR